ncbi:hypothetical protein NSTC731_06594 [Nostoc sp. DSM 114167]|jgi:hypothetical protein
MERKSLSRKLKVSRKWLIKRIMTTATSTNNPVIVPKKLPFLESICWQTADVYRFTPEEMLSRYERGWQYRNLFNNLEGEELNFLQELARRYKSWLQVYL